MLGFTKTKTRKGKERNGKGKEINKKENEKGIKWKKDETRRKRKGVGATCYIVMDISLNFKPRPAAVVVTRGLIILELSPPYYAVITRFAACRRTINNDRNVIQNITA